MVSSVVGNRVFGIAVNAYPLVHSSRLPEVRHAALPQSRGFFHGPVDGQTRRLKLFMRHPFIVSFAAWTTVVTVVLSALWLATIEEQIRFRGDGAPRSMGMRMAEPVRDAQANRRSPTHGALASSADSAAPPSSARAQMLAWTR